MRERRRRPGARSQPGGGGEEDGQTDLAFASRHDRFAVACCHD